MSTQSTETPTEASKRKRKRYPTDLTEREWAILEPLVPPAKPGGRPVAHRRREILNAILYVLRGGSSWRMIPHDLPPWQTAYYSPTTPFAGGASERDVGGDPHDAA